MNIEKEVIAYLKGALDTEHVYAEVSDSTAEEFFVVDKTGSSTEENLCTSTLAIQSYGDRKVRASELNEILKDAMEGITDRDGITGCHLVTDYNYSNITKKQHRYQAVFEITHY